MPCPIRRGRKLQALFNRAMQDERLVAIGLCSTDRKLLRTTPEFPQGSQLRTRGTDRRRARPAAAHRRRPGARGRASGQRRFRPRGRPGAAAGPELHRAAQPGHPAIPDHPHREPGRGDRAGHGDRRAAELARLGLGHARAAARRRPDTARWPAPRPSWRRWPPTCAPACATSRTNTAARRGPEADWNPERLQSLLRTQFSGDQVIVVSNREPYIHERSGGGIVVRAPGQRPGHRGRAGDAGLLRHLDRPRQRQRRPGGGRRPRPRARCRRATTSTCCAASGSPPRRSRATTTASPTKACGRCATWPMCGRCSASPTGRPTAR